MPCGSHHADHANRSCVSLFDDPAIDGKPALTKEHWAEPFRLGQFPLQPTVHATQLFCGAGAEGIRELPRGAFEVTDLAKSPIDRLEMGVANLLDHARASPLERVCR